MRRRDWGEAATAKPEARAFFAPGNPATRVKLLLIFGPVPAPRLALIGIADVLAHLVGPDFTSSIILTAVGSSSPAFARLARPRDRRFPGCEARRAGSC